MGQFEIINDLKTVDAKAIALEKKIEESEDSLAAAMEMLEECELTLRAKEAQILDVLQRLRSVEENAAVDVKELRLVSSELRQQLDEQEEESLRLIASVDAMRHGEGLDYDALIQTPVLKDICQYLLQFGSSRRSKRYKPSSLTSIYLSWMMKRKIRPELMPPERGSMRWR